MSTNVSPRLREEVADRAYHVCEYCLIHEDDTFWGCEADHIISKKHGGPTLSNNLAWACAVCNSHKGTDLGTLVGDPARLIRFYNPRADRWSGNFNLNGYSIDPLTQEGEGNVKILPLNDGHRLEERKALKEVGRLPRMEALARMKE
jgi:HNH endonuclease